MDLERLMQYACDKYEGLKILIKKDTLYSDILISMDYFGVKLEYSLKYPEALEDVMLKMISIIADTEQVLTNYGGKINGHSKEESGETKGHDTGTIIHQDNS